MFIKILIFICLILLNTPLICNAAGTTIKFKTVSCKDTQGIGIEAFKLLIPSTWQSQGEIQWFLDNPGTPARGSFLAWNPKGVEAFEILPKQPFFWTNNQSLLSMFPAGSKYFGNEVYPPVDAQEALQNIVIPMFRGNMSGLKIINIKQLPELARFCMSKAEPGLPLTADAAKVRIEYVNGGNKPTIEDQWDMYINDKKDVTSGVPMEEDIYCVVYYLTFQLPYGVKNINWAVDTILSCRAKKGELDKKAKLFQTIAYSFTVNPNWYNKYTQVVEYLIKNQIQQIKSAGELSRIISQTHDSISNSSMSSFNNNQASKEKMADEFCQYMRGVEEYYNPIEEKSVELPSGYTSAWTNSLGEYILSDNPNYNPNINSNLNWQEINKK